jgi:hypothetical protein
LGLETIALQEKYISLTKTGVKTGTPRLPVSKTESGALKSMTPLERTQEDSKEIKDRIDHLLS